MEGSLTNRTHNRKFATDIGGADNVLLMYLSMRIFFEINPSVAHKHTVTQKQAEHLRPHTIYCEGMAREYYSQVLAVFE